jgi:signal transduction histidine kinase
LCVNYRERHEFAYHDKQLIELFAQQASAVLASGELAREHERQRLEQDLHDWVQSDVLGLLFQCQAALHGPRSAECELSPVALESHLVDIERAAQGILADIRMLLRGVPKDSYQGQALEGIIWDDFRRFLGRSQARVQVDLAPDLPPLPVALTRTLLALTREAVVNALSHAQAQTITVHVRCRGPELLMQVDDDGRGVSLATNGQSNARGQANMRRRVECSGGNMTVTALPGGGTRLQVSLPLVQRENA